MRLNYENIFPWLYRCEDAFDMSRLSGYEIRMLGFLAEHYLSYWFQKKFSVFGIDLGRSCPSGLEGGYAVARTERIPFKDKAVDVAICAHVLEHIPDIFSALDELRRISALKIVVILPVERPYRFGFNLHVWFFPYRLNVMQIMRPKADVFWSLERIGNEWLYIEERS